jgi:threonine/homoserine/homoserine lactone efflux protein
LFWRGLLIGLAIAAPLGPVGVLVLRRSLAFGRTAGLVSGLGAATVDGLFAAIAGFGLTLVSSFLVHQATWMRFLGGLFMIGLGIQIIFSKPHLGDPAQAPEMSRGSRLGMYLSAFMLTLTNPLTIIAFTAIAAGGGVLEASSHLDTAAWVMGLFAGSALWWLALSWFAGLFHERLVHQPLLRQHSLLWINRIAGLVLAGFGIVESVRNFGLMFIGE